MVVEPGKAPTSRDGVSDPTHREPLSLAERKFIMRGDAGLMRWSQCGRAPISVQIVAVQDHLRLILCLGNDECGVHVQILRPRVIPAQLQAPAQPPNNGILSGDKNPSARDSAPYTAGYQRRLQ